MRDLPEIFIGENKYRVIETDEETNDHIYDVAIQTSELDIEKFREYIQRNNVHGKIRLERVSYEVPLYDVHCHLGGCIEPEFVGAMLLKSGIAKVRLGHVRRAMTYQNQKPSNFSEFLKKFDLLEQVRWTEKDIYDCIHQIISKVGRDGVSGCELRFSIDKYQKYLKIPGHDIIKIIYKASRDASEYFDVDVRLILAIRHGASDNKLRVAYDLPKYADYIDGIDINGDEKFYCAGKFKPIFELWKNYNKILMAHVGEQPGMSENVKSAILDLNCERISHGIFSDNYTLDLAKDRGVAFDISLSSNYYTGVITDRAVHPALHMLDNDNIITIGTDDASVFCTTLRKEFALVQKYWGLSDSEISGLKKNAINYSSFSS